MTTNAIRVLRDLELSLKAAPRVTVSCDESEQAPVKIFAEVLRMFSPMLDLLEKQTEEIYQLRRIVGSHHRDEDTTTGSRMRATDAALARLEQSVGEVGNV